MSKNAYGTYAEDFLKMSHGPGKKAHVHVGDGFMVYVTAENEDAAAAGLLAARDEIVRQQGVGIADAVHLQEYRGPQPKV